MSACCQSVMRLIILHFIVFSWSLYAASEKQNNTLLLSKPLTRFGRLEKQAALPSQRWLFFNRSLITDWLENRGVYVFEAKNASVLGPPPSSAPCGAWICKHEKVIVITHASEPWLMEVLGGPCTQQRAGSKSEESCFEPLAELLIDSTSDAIAELWAESTVIAAAPNPYVRAARAYQRVIGSWQLHDRVCNPLPFRDFARDPPSLALQGGLFRCGKPGNAYRGRQDGHRVQGIPDAVQDMTLLEPLSACLSTASGGWAIDFLIRADIDHIRQDLQAAIEFIAERRGGAARALGLTLNESAIRRQLMVGTDMALLIGMYDDCGEDCFNGIADFYRTDFHLLGFIDGH